MSITPTKKPVETQRTSKKFTLHRGSLDQPDEARQELMQGHFDSMVDLNRLTHWLIEGCEPTPTMYERLVGMHEEARRRGIC